MEVKKIRSVLTAIGNPILNDELKKIKNIKTINNDIQYQDGIFEILEINNNIDYLILSQLIPGELNINKLIEKIENINQKIKIILILEKYDENLENILIKKGVYRIFYNNKVEIKDIIKIIEENEKMEKYNEEIKREIEELKKYIKNNNNNNLLENKKNRKNNKKIKEIKNNFKKNNSQKIKYNSERIKNNYRKIKNYLNKISLLNTNKNNILKLNDKKVISILGNNGAGKSIFSVMLSKYLAKHNKKILIIDFDILNNSLHTILGVKKYSEKIRKIIENNNFDKKEIIIENLIININNKIDLISGINLIFDSANKISEEKLEKIIKKLSEFYDYIVIDTTSECFFEYTKQIINLSDECIFLTEPNLVELSKSKRILGLYDKWNINRNKIKILFNKFNKNSIDIKLLKNIYSDYSVLGCIKLENNYSKIINENFKNFENFEIKEKIFSKNKKILDNNLVKI